MELVAITVRNFRSITDAHKLAIGGCTVLLGPNNEGKSNILRALVAGLMCLRAVGRRPELRIGKVRIPSFILRRIYEWERDFPVHMQESEPNGKTIIVLEFKLNAREIEEFRTEVGSDLNGNLPIELAIGKDELKLTVRKRGPGGPALSKKVAKIGRFVVRRFDFQYIPAVRTAESAQKIVERIVARELEAVEENPGFKKALGRIEKIQKPILDEISIGIHNTLVDFLPGIKSVDVRIAEEERYEALRRHCRIVINDGTPTELQYKGDGVQSLAALGIMRHGSETGTQNKNLILAIEEPESHLHPRAIHQLRDVLGDISKACQVFVTTHCPLFVDRTNIKANIIVNKKKAQPARSIRQIRRALGVKASDNLRHADFVLLVEGEDDRIGLRALISHGSKKLARALSSNLLAIDTLGGVTGLSYKIGLIRDALCSYYCFLDDDKEAHKAVNKAIQNGLLTVAEVKFTTCPRKKEAEMEDLYNTNLYEDMVMRTYGVKLKGPKFRNNKKWSVRMRETFKHQGQRFGEATEIELKKKIADLVATDPGRALNRSV